MKCFYHVSDMDGRCAGAIVYQFFKPVLDIDYHVEMIGIDYRDDFDPKSILPNEKVWIVDYSFKPAIMEEILKITKDVTWLDHHKTALEYKYSMELPGIRSVDFAGCELTWKYAYPKLEMPRIVEMLGRYDVWDFSKYGNDLNKVQAGIRLFDHFPQSDTWNKWLNTKRVGVELDGIGWLDDGLDILLEQGSVALKYRDKAWAGLIKAFSFWTTFEGYKTICCNAGSVSSQLFDSITEEYDLMIPFVFDGKVWTVSVYTKRDDIDCSELAKKYGGGGHRKAAGFQCAELPFKRDK